MKFSISTFHAEKYIPDLVYAGRKSQLRSFLFASFLSSKILLKKKLDLKFEFFFLPFPEKPVFFFGICSCTRVGLSDIFTVLIWLIASVLITVGPEISAAVSRFFATSVFIGFATRFFGSTFFAFGFLNTIFGADWLLFFAG